MLVLFGLCPLNMMVSVIYRLRWCVRYRFLLTGGQHFSSLVPLMCDVQEPTLPTGREKMQQYVRLNVSDETSPAALLHTEVSTLDNLSCGHLPSDECVCAVGHQLPCSQVSMAIWYNGRVHCWSLGEWEFRITGQQDVSLEVLFRKKRPQQNCTEVVEEISPAAGIASGLKIALQNAALCEIFLPSFQALHCTPEVSSVHCFDSSARGCSNPPIP